MRVIVTGAASGIGAEAAKQMRAQGATVVGLDLHPGEDVIACDVTDQASVDEAVAEAIERLGGLDVLVNNAGIGTPQSAVQRPGEDAERVLAVNLLGPWRVTGAAIDALRASRGRVVNVASGLAHLTVPFATAYCMSKRGLTAYSEALRYEAGHEITVTTVYPGYVKTPIHDASEQAGIALGGLVPEEPLSAVAARVARAALGPPVRDLATTRSGTVSYAVLRRLPRRVVDAAVVSTLRRTVRRGAFDRSEMAADFVRGLRAGGSS
jgi:NAD(P)-dependent dehydrogenase (short-subunit alcohol dehydrogenase family)